MSFHPALVLVLGGFRCTGFAHYESVWKEFLFETPTLQQTHTGTSTADTSWGATGRCKRPSSRQHTACTQKGCILCVVNESPLPRFAPTPLSGVQASAMTQGSATDCAPRLMMFIMVMATQRQAAALGGRSSASLDRGRRAREGAQGGKELAPRPANVGDVLCDCG